MAELNSIYKSSEYGRDFVRRMVSRLDDPNSEDLLQEFDDLMQSSKLRVIQSAKFMVRTIILGSSNFDILERTYMVKKFDPEIKEQIDDELARLTSKELVAAINSNRG